MTPHDVAKVIEALLNANDFDTSEQEEFFEAVKVTAPVENTIIATDPRDGSQFNIQVKTVSK